VQECLGGRRNFSEFMFLDPSQYDNQPLSLKSKVTHILPPPTPPHKPSTSTFTDASRGFQNVSFDLPFFVFYFLLFPFFTPVKIIIQQDGGNN